MVAYIDGGSRGNPGPAGYGVRSIEIRSDSKLLVRQMLGVYRVKNAALLPLFQEARALVARIGRVHFTYVRRDLNVEADRLANEAMDGSDGH